jgi:proline iminopeptidase
LTQLLVGVAACAPNRHDAQSMKAPVSGPDTGSVVSSGFRLRYIAEGAGAPTLVVGSSRYYARAFSQNLRKHLRLVFVDHRGFTASPGRSDTAAFAMDSLIDDIERIRRHLGLGRVAIMGHSGHAFMALEYAKKYPANVSHVIMIGVAPDFGEANTQSIEQYWQATASADRKAVMAANLQRMPDADLARLAPRDRFVASYVRDGPRAWYDPRFDASRLWEGVEINMDMLDHVWGRTFAQIDITRGLNTLDPPVYLALGRFDYLVAPPNTWDRVRPVFRDLTVRIFERSGHTPQYEEAGRFDEELVRWMSGWRER